MKLPARTPRENPEQKPSHGLCYAVIDLGVQKPGANSSYGPKHKVCFMFELDQTMTQGEHAGKPFGVSRMFGATLNEKGMLQDFVKGWIGRLLTADDDIDAVLIGRPALLNIQLEKNAKGDVNANILTAMPPMNGFRPWVLQNGKGNPTWKYPRWISKMRANALERPADYPSQWDVPITNETEYTPDSQPV